MQYLLDKYEIQEEISRDDIESIYRAKEINSKKTLLLKRIKPEYNTIAYLQKLEHEIKISQEIPIKQIVKSFDLATSSKETIVIAENKDGVSLKHLIQEDKLQLTERLKIARKLAELLDTFQKKKFLHKNLQSDKILYSKNADEIYVLNFRFADFVNELGEKRHENPLLGRNFSYIAPEQTGRTDISSDSRTDIYSAGIILYELFTGQLPYKAETPSELIYQHLAQEPPAPNTIKKEIPEVISAILTKLLQKSPSDRYQSATALKKDIEKCIISLDNYGYIKSFPIAKKDYISVFQIPEKLYGRNKELNILKKAYSEAKNGEKPLVAIKGFSGTGKTALVNEFRKSILTSKSFFILGKYNKFTRTIPYSGIAEALQSLTKTLLTQSTGEIETWKEKIEEALPGSGKVLLDLIPELRFITGENIETETLSSEEQQNRLLLNFNKFIQVFAQADHPLILVLDDVHWMDEASLSLLENLLFSKSLKNILIILAYRDNELPKKHALLKQLERYKLECQSYWKIPINSLETRYTNKLVAETLLESEKDVYNLAQTVQLKTKGNPFFVKQFIKNLYNEGHIWFDENEGQWKWDIEKIKTTEYTENTVLFVIEIIQKLPPEVLNLLKHAACLGSKFDLKSMSLVLNKKPREIAHLLNTPIKEGLIAPISEKAGLNLEEVDEFNFTYKFLHDSIHQSVYSIIEDQIKKQMHWKIGNVIEQNAPDGERESFLFDIVNQKNKGIDESHESRKESIHLAELNLAAGIKAKNSAAYDPALRYFQKGRELAGNDWEHDYNLLFKLTIEAAESAYLTGKFKLSEELLNRCLAHALTRIDSARVYEIQIQASKALNNNKDALKSGLNALSLFGLKFPENPSKLSVLKAFIKIKLAVNKKNIKGLADLPELKDPEKIAIIRILSNLQPAAYLAKPELLPLLTFEQVYLSIKNGNTDLSSYAYAVMGLIVTNAIGDIQLGYAFGQLALKVLDKFDNKALKSRTYFVYNMTIRPWRHHLSESVPALYEAYLSGLESGDFEYAGNTIAQYLVYSYFTGKELSHLEKEMEFYKSSLEEINQELNVHYIRSFHNFILQIQKNASIPAKEEKEILRFHEQGNDHLGIFLHFFLKMMHAYYTEDFDTAIEQGEKALPFMESALGIVVVPYFYFFRTLSLIAQVKKNKIKYRDIKQELKKATKELKKRAKYAPMNYLPLYSLIMAERYSLLRKNNKAEMAYQEAMGQARNGKFTHLEILGYQLYAEFLMQHERKEEAGKFLIETYNGYSRWGAHAMADLLEANYKDLIIDATSHSKKMALTDPAAHLLRPLSSENIDLISIVQASQALSEEIQLDNLINKLLDITIENTASTKGVLMLNEKGSLRVKAVKTIKDIKPVNISSTYLEKYESIPHEIINYVSNTGELIVLNDACSSGDYVNSKYITRQKPRSVLCVPIIRRSKTKGVIYLENTLAPNTYTEAKLKTIQLLSGQMAISLENAQFYNNLEQEVRERTSELEQQKEEILVQTEHLKMINQDLENKNNKINYQKKEIQEQANLLQEKNKELEKLSIIAEKTDNSITIAGIDGKLEWVNKAFHKIHGYTLEEFKRLRGSTLEEASTHSEINEKLDFCIREKRSIDYYSYEILPDGKKLWLQTTITPVLNDEGKVYKLIAIDSDISQLKDAEEQILKQKDEIEAQRDFANEQREKIEQQNAELEKHRNHLEQLVKERTKELEIAKQKAEESDRLKSSFLANMSHEIRTPMNAIIGFSDLLTDPELPQEDKKDLSHHIHSNCNTLLHLIDDIIDLARIETGQLRIYKNATEIHSLLQEVYTNYEQTELREKENLDFRLEKERPEEEFFVETDTLRLKQILNNLLSNAFKFTDKGNIRFGYQQIEEKGRDFLLFFVKDTGIGLSQEQQNQVFSRFNKIQSNVKKLYRGAGLGLSITKTLVEELGGKIWVESEVEKGTNFYFTIPFKEAGSGNVEKADPTEKIQYNWEGKKILIVEDEESNIRMIEMLLKKTKAELLFARDGIEALETCKNEKDIDTILMDVKMPNMDGITATKKLKDMHPNMPVIIFSAFAMEEDRESALEAGAKDFVAKPIKSTELLETISKHIQ